MMAKNLKNTKCNYTLKRDIIINKVTEAEIITNKNPRLIN